MSLRIKKTSATTLLLMALVPYTDSKLPINFDPNKFIHELDNLTEHSYKNIKLAYRRAVSNGWIIINGRKLSLSMDARLTIEPFMAHNLRESNLMVIFDFPEQHADTRRRFRSVLKNLEFIQVQQSVWQADRDYRNIISELVDELDVARYVQIYEVQRIK